MLVDKFSILVCVGIQEDVFLLAEVLLQWFGLENQFQYAYDLAEEWQKFTQLPFVFACWVANKKLTESFIKEFNAALKFGVDNRSSLIEELTKTISITSNIEYYLNQNIKYDFDNSKKKALALFLDYMSKLE